MSSKEERPRGTPTVSRIVGDTIVELVYDPEKQTTGLVVSRFGGLWNIEQELKIATGETLVPYTARNNLIANDCILLPSRPVEFGFKEELIADIQAFVHRYVDLSPTFESIAAHYVLLTWVYDRFNELPYLRIRGDYGSGKTRALLAVGSLCYKAFFASGASTLSPIFHTLNSFGGTLVLDEADFRFSDKSNELVKLFNNGTVRGMPVLRTIINKEREFNPHAFKVFGPKLVAMRGSFEDNALESRFITEESGGRPLRADIPIQLPNELKSEALDLRNRLLHFRLCNLFSIKADLSALIEGAEPRLNQTALALLSLVDDPTLRLEMQQHLLHEHALAGSRHPSIEVCVLRAVMHVVARSDAAAVSVQAITDRFNEQYADMYGHRVSNKWIGHALRRRLNLTTQRSGGVYVVPVSERPKILELARRLGVDSGSGEAAQ